MSSTLDIVFTSYGLANDMVYCVIHTVDHGSDHKGIVLETSILLDNYKEKEKKRLYYNTDWEAIRAAFKQNLATRYTWTSLDTKSQLDQAAEDLGQSPHHTQRDGGPGSYHNLDISSQS
jgi:hypothetical protein